MEKILALSGAKLIEQLGTKEKYWIDYRGEKYLFKVGREKTRENLSEVIAYKIAFLSDIRAAKYLFARFENKLGVASKSIVSDNESLIHGNELLVENIKNYPATEFYKVKDYKLSTVLEVLDKLNSDFAKEFIGYLVFDALIANQDRHHENWAIIQDENSKFKLAPTFDHGSSLGCREPIEKIKRRLITKDRGFSVETFCKRAVTPFYDKDNKLMKTIEVVKFCKNFDKTTTEFYVNKISALQISKIEDFYYNEVPNEYKHDIVEVEFIKKILEINKQRLEDII
ncbi:HipA domain-containing protein [Caminibacter pacificus]